VKEFFGCKELVIYTWFFDYYSLSSAMSGTNSEHIRLAINCLKEFVIVPEY